MAITAMVPELVVAIAIQQYLEAKKALEKASVIVGNESRFSLTHAFFANIGGLLIKDNTGSSLSKLILKEFGKSFFPSMKLDILFYPVFQQQ
jgi:hypothetical protein